MKLNPNGRTIYQPIFFVIALCIAPVVAFSQPVIDSLEKVSAQHLHAGNFAGYGKAEYKISLAYYNDYNDTLALVHLKKAIDAFEKAGSGRDLAISYNYYGNLLDDLGKLPEAIDMYKTALEKANQLNNDTLRARIDNNLALAYKGIGNYEESIKLLYEALKLKEKTGATPKSISATLLNIGLVLDIIGKSDDAINYYNQSIALKLKEDDSLGISRIYSNIAVIYKNKGNLTLAEDAIVKSTAFNTTLKNKSQLYINYTNLGNIRKRQGNSEEALQLLKLALHHAEDMNSVEKLSDACQNIGVLYLENGNPLTALSYLNRALEYTSETRSWAQMNELHSLLAETHSNLSHDNEAYHHLRLSNQYRDSLYTQEGQRAVEEMKTRYETEKKEKTIAQQQTNLAQQELELKERTMWLTISAAAVLLVILSAVVLIWRQQIKEKQVKQQALLDMQNERLRISRDLHDNIGAELTLISSALYTEAQRVESGGRERLQDINSYAKNAMEQLRETVWAIRQDKISAEEFYSKVREYGTKVCSTANIRFTSDIRLDKEIELSPAQTIGLFRVCQEAINNAIKYAGGDTVSIVMCYADNQLHISISDDGKGFDVHENSGGYGLDNMRERVSELHGEISIVSEVNKGTEVSLRLAI